MVVVRAPVGPAESKNSQLNVLRRFVTVLLRQAGKRPPPGRVRAILGGDSRRFFADTTAATDSVCGIIPTLLCRQSLTSVAPGPMWIVVGNPPPQLGHPSVEREQSLPNTPSKSTRPCR